MKTSPRANPYSKGEEETPLLHAGVERLLFKRAHGMGDIVATIF